MGIRMSSDCGGTFTDFIHETEAGLRSFKVPSTPQDPSIAVREGIDRMGGSEALDVLLHGTTVATNAVLERKGDRVAFICSRGFGDVPFIQRQRRTGLYDLAVDRARPFIHRKDVREVDTVTAPDGLVERGLDMDKVRAMGEGLKEGGVETAAVLFIHSYANPVEENMALEALMDTGLTVSTSSGVSPLFREAERASTVILDAYVKRLVSDYLRRIGGSIGNATGYAVQSHGGLSSFEEAAGNPVGLLLSGPAGGVAGSARLSHAISEPNLVTLDVGGTSADISIIRNGEPTVLRSTSIAGHPIQAPSLDIDTIGAGGGSVVWKDSGGALRVGPESVGSTPGPLCYDRDGTQVSMTDIHLAAGRIDPEYFLGGSFPLRKDLTMTGVIAGAAGFDVALEEYLNGALSVQAVQMAGAIQTKVASCGMLPREFGLLSFGGGGGLYATDLLERMGFSSAVIPPFCGAFSALGIHHSRRMRYIYRSALFTMESVADRERVSAMLEGTLSGFRSAAGIAFPDGRDDAVLLDMRFSGQSHELEVPYEGDLDEAISAFRDIHIDRYGFAPDSGGVELVNIILRSSELGERPFDPRAPDAPGIAHEVGRRKVLFGTWQDAAVYRRVEMGEGAWAPGPCIIEDLDTTIPIPAGMTFVVHESGAIVIRKD